MRPHFSNRVVALLRGSVLTLGFSALIVAGLAPPAQADRPTVDNFEVTFPDVNPCTDDIHTVSIRLTLFQHFHGDRFVEHGESTVTTSTGYSGGGTTTFVMTNKRLVFRSLDLLMSDESGSAIMARLVFVQDLETGAVKVVRSALTCIHA
jgi:hypothetical protein